VEGARGVIINITGGPDMTLAEVKDASEIIHRAAHEDANIIFGAVVDPKMEGKVKITVIATGFDRSRVAASPAAQATVHTPVDLTAYTVRPQEERLVVNGGISRASFARRAPIELPSGASAVASAISVPAAVIAAPDPAPGELNLQDLDEIDEPSPFDVPAFLRRQEG